MENYLKKISEDLLEINAIKLRMDNYFTWASGLKSPIYCDNRKTLSYPKTRSFIKKEFAKIIKKKYPEVEMIVGVATGAIAHGVLLAEYLNLPFSYVRASAKGHGLQNLIEGEIKEKQKVLVIEDLISTGGSSLKAVEVLRKSKCEVLGMLSIFSYGFEIAKQNFQKKNCELTTLSDFNALIKAALEKNYINNEELEILKKWRKDF
ncbi:MAG: orotate phosphoribosyltransferase [Bacteroidetes bacterium 4572_128]|nr:MAG: orotate phosphoribosyltransferase [Bacteroidetes bacterium 4572_128]